LLEVLGNQGDVTAYEAQETGLRDAGFDEQKLQDIRARCPKLSSALPLAATAPLAPPGAATNEPALNDEFQLNLDDLSMDSSWDLISPFENTSSATKASNEPTPIEPSFTSNLHVLPDVFEMPDASTLDEPELEWLDEPDSPSLDDSFLNEFTDPGELQAFEPLSLAPAEPSNAGKLEQAQSCIDDGDLDGAIELLNELLKEGNEPLKQTARNLLAGLS
jgi:FimV-like protein